MTFILFLCSFYLMFYLINFYKIKSVILYGGRMKSNKEKDITQKTLERYNDVFADIINVLLFDGRRVVTIIADDGNDKGL